MVEAARERGLAVYGLEPYRVTCRGRAGPIFGYATLDERALAEGVDTLAEVIAAHRTVSGGDGV